MERSSLTWTTERSAVGLLRLSFHGRGGFGSDGNVDGDRMREAILEALADESAKGLVVDLSGYEYRFGDWIGAILVGVGRLGVGHVCVVAVGKTAAALRPFWVASKADQAAPLFEGIDEAVSYLSASEPT